MRWLLIILIIPQFLFAQKWVGSNTHADIDKRKAQFVHLDGHVSNDTNAIKNYLLQHLSNLKHTDANLQLVDFRESPKARHYHFVQTLNGRKVFRGSVKINVSLHGKILSTFDNTFAVEETTSNDFPDHQPYHDGLMVHYDSPGNGNLHDYNLEEVYYPVGQALEPAIRLEVVERQDQFYELVLNRNVKVIYQNDLLSYVAPALQDSVVTLWVFDPDPLTSANQVYGAPYADNSDNDVLELNAERIPVQAVAKFESDTFFLENEYIKIQDHSLPNVAPVIGTEPVFNYTRSESGFEDANAFYHITNFQHYIQSLGFNDIVNYQIAVDTHAANGADNSSFNAGFNPPRLQFGEGGVDDAEDADVIIHEYGHAIMHSAAPGTNFGTERQAMDEAVGDYFASSYSRSVSSHRWEDVFTWDGHNEFWNGRSSVSSDFYPDDLAGNLYSDADVWSATLMQIWEDIGREATDAIMIQAAYSFASNMTMNQAAEVFLQADSLLFEGDHTTPILDRMCARGLLNCNVGIEEWNSEKPNFKVYNTAGFASGQAPLRVIAEDGLTIQLFNAVGQLLLTRKGETKSIELGSNGLTPGIYLLEVSTESSTSTVKLVKH